MWSFINIGTCFRYLQEAKKGREFFGSGNISGNAGRLLEYFENLNLHVTRRAAYKLENTISELTTKHFEKESHLLTDLEAKEISKIVAELRPTFVAEAQGIFTYTITEKRLDIEKLLFEQHKFFPPNVYEKIPEICKYDYVEACRCIALNRATAAAFHLMRAIEALLKLYYKKYIRPAKSGLTWGQMTYALKAKKSGKLPNETTLNQLEHIRIAFRNPTQHPEKIYEIEESQDLLFLCLDVTNRMVSEIKN